MSGFEYSALEATGRETRGVIEADTERHARSLLRERGLAPLTVESIRATVAQSGRRERFSRPGLSRKGLALVTRQFATLVRAGLTIVEGLNVLIEQTESAGARTPFAAVRARVLEGQPLPHSLFEFHNRFPLIFRAISDFARASGAFWLAGLVLAFIAGRLLLRDESRRRRWHGWLLRVPLVGKLTRSVNAARFADTLGILTSSGVPLLASLQSAAAVLTNLPMRAAVDEAVRRVREGGALAPALGAAKLFPPLVIHLIASGEATGRLDTMLARAAEAQSRELVNWTRGLTALLGPLLILAMGVVVLFVVLAILLPIFEVNQLVR